MKRIFAGLLMIFVAVAAWRVGNALSSDAISMAIGVLFGVLAGIPSALLVLASDRRRQEGRDGHTGQPGYAPAGGQLGYGQSYAHYPQQPPIIVVTGGAPAQAGQQSQFGQANPYAMTPQSTWPGQRPARNFRMVGEQEGMLDDM